MQGRAPVIVALDPPPGEPDPAGWAAGKAALLAGAVAGCKVGLPLALRLGSGGLAGLARRLRSAGCRLLVADFKVADVPHTAARMARAAAEAGFDVVIAHAFAGADVLAAVAGEGVEVWAVAALSSPGASRLADPLLPRLVEAAAEGGASGLVLPATRPWLVSAARRLGWRGVIASPGVGAQGARPCQALGAGADYEIVGRSLVNAADPAGWLASSYGPCLPGGGRG